MSLKRLTSYIFVFATLLLFALNTLAGQSPDDDRRFRVEVEAVNILVTVIEKDTGEFNRFLTKEDFRIFEDGVEQEITNFSRQTNMPLTIALLVDTSSSVKLKLKFEKEAALDFLYSVMLPQDRTLLAEFDTGVTLLHDFTSNPNDLANEIKRLKAGGGTSLYDAIYLISEQKLLFETGRRTLVILSDGSDLTSTHTYESALGMAQRAEAAIYALSTTRFGADIDHAGDNALKQLTENTGGRVFFPYSTSQLSKAFREIQEELRSQYNLAYVPTNKLADGSFRKISVKVDRGGMDTRYRKGYFAPLAEQEVD